MNQIGDYALIGDCHSAALVGRDGSIDWACFPRFDSDAVFARILDADHGGHFQVAPVAPHQVRRAYVEDTNVLRTQFETATGRIELLDCMPVLPFDPARPTEVRAHGSILRQARCVEGEVALRIGLAPRFEYGAFSPRFRATSPTTVEIVGGADALWLTCSHPLQVRPEGIDAVVNLRAGEALMLELAWSASFVEKSAAEHPSLDALHQRLDDTLAFWRGWLAQCRYQGAYVERVRRSALALKALTYAPTGAVVAAPTTSLPEEVGGARNWDYRYTWIRDSTLTLISLMVLGFRAEADGFRQWLRRTSSGRPGDLQIMYGILGHRSLPEVELAHLAGHRGSRPVRVGNGAVKQLQLDVYGSLMQASYVYAHAGGTVSPTNWEFLSGLAELVCARWREPDQGLWEIRDAPRHFVHSKLLCWTALDRALGIARLRGLPADVARWTRERDALRAYLLDDAQRRGWFAQAVGSDQADASCLLIPAMGFLPPGDPRVRETIRQVRAQLETDGLLFRYRAADGLAGGESAFLLCSFWLADALIHAGELAEAEQLVERLLGLCNDVGLYAEEAGLESGEAIGNFPQAFTHMALVTTCAHLTAAREGALPPSDTAYDFAELALGRLRR